VSNSSPEPNLEPLSRTQILAAIAVTAIVLLLIVRCWMFFDPNIVLRVSWAIAPALIGIGIGLGITAASGLLYQCWPAYRDSADLYLKLVLYPLTWPDLVWLGLLPGLSEELLFRGVLLPALGMNAFGLIASSLCFGILHFSGSQQWPYVLWATIIGGVLGFGAIATGNLLVPIAAHVTTNLLSSCLWKWETQSAKSGS
jgi:membrane protease YdiL (CAAX protease family)